MTNTINNGALYEEEILSEEQLECVQGGLATELVVAGLTILVERGISEADDIKALVNSTEYKNMSAGDRNKKLGKELANSWALCGIVSGLSGLFGSAAVAYAQVKWRTSGTSDGLRNAIENMF